MKAWLTYFTILLIIFTSCGSPNEDDSFSKVQGKSIENDYDSYVETNLNYSKTFNDIDNKEGKLIRSVDTIAHNYRFSLKLYESEDVLERTVTNWLGESEVHHYPEMIIEIDFTADGKNVITKKRIEKDFFKDYVTYHKMSDITMFVGRIAELEKENVVLELSLCVPDTCDCYMFYVNFHTNGRISIEEREIDWDFD